MNSGRCVGPIASTRNLHLGSFLDQLKEVSCISITWLGPLLSLRVNINNQVNPVQAFWKAQILGVKLLLKTSGVV